MAFRWGPFSVDKSCSVKCIELINLEPVQKVYKSCSIIKILLKLWPSGDRGFSTEWPTLRPKQDYRFQGYCLIELNLILQSLRSCMISYSKVFTREIMFAILLSGDAEYRFWGLQGISLNQNVITINYILHFSLHISLSIWNQDKI